MTENARSVAAAGFRIPSVLKKMLTAITGLGLVAFVILHLLGNLVLYAPNGATQFNAYSAKLASLGGLLYALEILLLVAAVVHAVNGILLKRDNARARGQKYAEWKSKDAEPSNRSSRSMVLTGVFLLGFLVFHLLHFKFGKSIDEGYVMQVDGQPVRDLHRLVIETFSSLGYTVFYVIAMWILGMHLKHGIWSALHTLGATRPDLSRRLRQTCAVLGVILAAGFLGIPVWLYVQQNFG